MSSVRASRWLQSRFTPSSLRFHRLPSKRLLKRPPLKPFSRSLGLAAALVAATGLSPLAATPQVPGTMTPGTMFRDALKDGGQGPQMVVLPTGSFSMGSPSTEVSRHSGEGPVRTVTISRPIVMGRYPVTFADYDRFANADSRRSRPADEGWGRGSRPVIRVRQEDAKAYAVWLSAQTGKTYRLPSESEWEYAARAGMSTHYSWCDEIGVNRANCAGCGRLKLNSDGTNAKFSQTYANQNIKDLVFYRNFAIGTVVLGALIAESSSSTSE